MPSLFLKNVRLSFPDIFDAVQYQGAGPFRFNASFLIEPGSENDKHVQAAIQEAAAEKFGKKGPAFVEANKGNSNKFCYVNGNTKEYDGYQGMMCLSAHRKQDAGRPLIIDQLKQPLTAADGKPYAGCYVNASVDIYAQDGTNAGIRCGLKGVQFVKDGDAFSGSAVAKLDDFDTIEEGATADDLV
jgi:hypothetical protein